MNFIQITAFALSTQRGKKLACLPSEPWLQFMYVYVPIAPTAYAVANHHSFTNYNQSTESETQSGNTNVGIMI